MWRKQAGDFVPPLYRCPDQLLLNGANLLLLLLISLPPFPFNLPIVWTKGADGFVLLLSCCVMQFLQMFFSYFSWPQMFCSFFSWPQMFSSFFSWPQMFFSFFSQSLCLPFLYRESLSGQSRLAFSVTVSHYLKQMLLVLPVFFSFSFWSFYLLFRTLFVVWINQINVLVPPLSNYTETNVEHGIHVTTFSADLSCSHSFMSLSPVVWSF